MDIADIQSIQMVVWVDGESVRTIEQTWPTPPAAGGGYSIELQDETGKRAGALNVALYSPVGGIAVPVDKLALLAPYIGLAIAIAAVAVGAVYSRKRWLGKAIVQKP